ncbi:MAG: hypothetical protein LRZ84_03880 [Desertifilum sp.]|nr:hypothetical protein [Desertifilum sp.]
MKLYADRVTDPKPLSFTGGMRLFQPQFTARPEVSPNQWVKLTQPLSDYSDDEALLLCQQSATEWVVWIPGYGEAIVNQSKFC